MSDTKKDLKSAVDAIFVARMRLAKLVGLRLEDSCGDRVEVDPFVEQLDELHGIFDDALCALEDDEDWDDDQDEDYDDDDEE